MKTICIEANDRLNWLFWFGQKQLKVNSSLCARMISRISHAAMPETWWRLWWCGPVFSLRTGPRALLCHARGLDPQRKNAHGEDVMRSSPHALGTRQTSGFFTVWFTNWWFNITIEHDHRNRGFSQYIHTHTYINIYTYIYICMYVCM